MRCRLSLIVLGVRPAIGETKSACPTLMRKQLEVTMDQDVKREIVVLTLSTLAAVPVVTVAGLAIVAGVLSW